MPHFGLAMSVDDFGALAERVQAAGVKFIIEPHIRFKGQPGEQVVFLSFGVLCFLQVCFLIRKVEV